MIRRLPTHVQHGESHSRLAVVMSPVMPLWDRGSFFDPVTSLLVDAGFHVHIFDTLSLLSDEIRTLEDMAIQWSSLLGAIGQIDLIAGSALGGAVVQAMMASGSGVAEVPDVLLISSPTLADDVLNARLNAMAELAGECRLDEAVAMLDRLIRPEPCTGMAMAHGVLAESSDAAPRRADRPSGNPWTANTPGSATSRDQAAAEQAHRLHRGFQLLRDIDLRDVVEGHAGRLLSIHGQRSQLVRDVNVHVGRAPGHKVLAVPDAGMRPLSDDPLLVLSKVKQHFGLLEELSA